MDEQKALETLERLIEIRGTLFSEDFETAKNYALKAMEVMGDFGSVCVAAETEGVAVPESLLPHDRETIKDSLRFLLLAASDEGFCDNVKASYQFLASFVSDEDYEEEANQPDEIEASGDLELETLTRDLGTVQKVTEGMSALEEELNRWLEDTQRKLEEAERERVKTPVRAPEVPEAASGCMVILTVVGLAAVAGGLLSLLVSVT